MSQGGRSAPRLRPDLAPLRSSRGFALLFASRTVTALGTLASEVALLVQARQLTGSPLAVGLLGVAELVPLVVFGLYGGVLADRFDRRALMRWCEAALGGCAVLLLINALLPDPALWPLYAVTAVMMAAASLQRPSIDASVPRLVRRDQLTAASALLSMSQTASFLLGSALGGVLAVTPGPWLVYGIEAAGFAASFGLLTLLPRIPRAAGTDHAAPHGIATGLRYAVRRQYLLGSYLADLAAMIFAYPNALFPFLAAELHARWATGLMFAAPSVGAFGVTLVSGWMGRVRRHGLAIALSAAAWGVAMAGFGLSPGLYVALACLVAAGAADMVSGIFRETLWNQTIPDELRGRLAGVELLSYGIGPPAGQLRSGLVASLAGARFALVSGGLFCVGAVVLISGLLPGFVRYQGPGTGRCPAAQGSAGHRADGVLGRPVPTQRNGVNADMDQEKLPRVSVSSHSGISRRTRHSDYPGRRRLARRMIPAGGRPRWHMRYRRRSRSPPHRRTYGRCWSTWPAIRSGTRCTRRRSGTRPPEARSPSRAATRRPAVP